MGFDSGFFDPGVSASSVSDSGSSPMSSCGVRPEHSRGAAGDSHSTSLIRRLGVVGPPEGGRLACPRGIPRRTSCGGVYAKDHPTTVTAAAAGLFFSVADRFRHPAPEIGFNRRPSAADPVQDAPFWADQHIGRVGSDAPPWAWSAFLNADSAPTKSEAAIFCSPSWINGSEGEAVEAEATEATMDPRKKSMHHTSACGLVITRLSDSRL